LFAALFPSDCRLCGSPLENISRLPVCLECIATIQPLSTDTCDICGEGIAGPRLASASQLCTPCQESRPVFSKAVAFGAYDQELRGLIHLLKYDSVIPAASVLGKMLTEAIGKLSLDSPSFVVIPIPLHASKRRHRGFNQAESLARAALKKAPGAELLTDVLERHRATASQIGLTRSQRAENIRGAFLVAHPTKVAGRDVLLIDDVMTTGITASECARVLRKAGAREVWVATVARTLKHSTTRFETEPRFETAAAAS